MVCTQVCQLAAERTPPVPALCAGAELCRCGWVRGFVGPAIAPARMCRHSSSCLCARFGGCVDCVVGLEDVAAEAVSA